MPRPLYKSFLLLTRTLHIYLTMLVLVLLIFFSVTGFFLNHPEWFSLKDPVIRDYTAEIPTPLAADRSPDHKLTLVEHLRTHNGARGELTSYDEQDEETRIQFTGPGRKIEFAITAADGSVQIHEELHNTLALLSDLHKGTYSGFAWRRFIDATSIVLCFASLSGLILWTALPKRRTLGLIALTLSISLCLACYFWLVP
jgi:hypothetical protein